MQSLLIVALCQALFVGQVPILLTLFLAGLSQCLLGDRNGHCLWILWVASRKEWDGGGRGRKRWLQFYVLFQNNLIITNGYDVYI